MKNTRSLQSMLGKNVCSRAALVALLGAALAHPLPARADTTPLTVLDPSLEVTTFIASGLTQPIGIVFLGSTRDYLVLEKASGQVKRVIGGVLQPTPVLDLAVNSNSERGLLSLVLHPSFPRYPTCTFAGPRARRAPILQRSPRCRCWATASIASSGTAAR